MSDLISRSALLKKIAHHTMFDCLKRVTFETANTYEQVKGAMFELAQKAPAVDAVPVVHARWEYNPGDNIPYCSNCAMPQDVPTNYCHGCGAKMRGETDEE